MSPEQLEQHTRGWGDGLPLPFRRIILRIYGGPEGDARVSSSALWALLGSSFLRQYEALDGGDAAVIEAMTWAKPYVEEFARRFASSTPEKRPLGLFTVYEGRYFSFAPIALSILDVEKGTTRSNVGVPLVDMRGVDLVAAYAARIANPVAEG